ncbi:MAG: AmmeMemoRadiSam system protein A [bacterium]
MAVVWGGIAPHPPIVVPEVGQDEIAKVASTRQALQQLALSIKEAMVDTVVITTPHGPVFQDAIALSLLPTVGGDFGNFGAAQVSFNLSTDLELTQAIMAACQDLGVPTVGLDAHKASRFQAGSRLDHGVLVPWYYLSQAGVNLPLVWVGMSLLPPEELYAFGVAVQQAANKIGRKVAFLASGDLSHRLIKGAPAGYHPDGARFDAQLVEKVRHGDMEGVLQIDPVLAEKAGECGWRSIMMLIGALDGQIVAPQVLSYEGPFGVGYLVAELKPQGELPALKRLQRLRDERRQQVAVRRAKESMFVRLARESLETYVRTGHELPVPDDLPPELRQRAGVFVSLKKQGQLRGCIGTTEPTQRNLAAEIIANAISAGTRDPRFWPVQEDELGDIVYSVDVLGVPEPVVSLAELDPLRYGVIVHGPGGRSGLLLPDLAGIDTAEKQVEIAKEKAGLSPGDDVKLERFGVKRYY